MKYLSLTLAATALCLIGCQKGADTASTVPSSGTPSTTQPITSPAGATATGDVASSNPATPNAANAPGATRGGAGGQQRGPASARYLARADVQDDLALTADQKAKFAKLNDALKSASGAGQPPAGGAAPGGQGAPGGNAPGRGGPGGGGGGGGRAARGQFIKDAMALLTPTQKTRLQQIEIQIAGNRSVTDPEVGKAVGLTADQDTKITDLMTASRDANRAAMTALRAENPDRATMQAAMKKSADALNEQIGKILTSDEIGKLKSLAGKPFVAKQPIGGPGGGPGGPGG